MQRGALTLSILALTIPVAASDQARATAARLEPCRLPRLDEPALCGALEVFEDRAAGKGRRIALRVAVLPATGSPKAPDPLFVLQGGPGQAATRLAEFYGTTFKALRRQRDIVLVDQRGTGGSNALECDLFGDGTDPQRFLGPAFPVAEVKACRQRLSAQADLALYSTAIAMQDLDEVRAWLGYKRINLYGTSYGTLAAQEYMRRLGPRVRSAVLKAAVAPARGWGVFWARNTQQALDRLLEACTADEACRRAFPHLPQDLAAVLDRLGKGPVPVEVTLPEGAEVSVKLTRSAAVTVLRTSLGAPATAVQLPLMIHQAARDDWSSLATAALHYRRGAGPELSEGMFFTIMCSEVTAGLDAAALARESAGTLVGEEPMRELMAACAEWPRTALPDDFAQPLRTQTPVLVVSGRLDPSTPWENGELLVRHMPGARHLIVKNGAHSFNNLAGCVDEVIAAFVASGSAVGLDTGCADRIALPPFGLPAAATRPTARRGPAFVPSGHRCSHVSRSMEPFGLPLSGRPALESYTRDLTDAALRDELEPVRCREAETDRVVAILLRQSKNNPVLVGEAGVGKTAIVEGLAQRITAGHVPSALARARILMLSHIDLIAGTTFRGQFEKRLQGVIEQASRDPHAILFIDELHNLIGAGSALGQPLDAANLIKPALSRGELRVIGATTSDEYERYVLPDAALERRFHPVEVEELGGPQTLEVLRARRPRLEMHHVLAITDAALEHALALSETPGRGRRQRKQPDKAIDLLDEACALDRLRHPRPQPISIAGLVVERARLLAVERESIDALLSLAGARGNLLERFSFGTYKALEAMGLGIERLVTGQTTPRRPLPRPDSLQRLEADDPAARLAEAHRDRLLTEDRLREALVSAGFVIDVAQVEAAGESPG